MKTNITGHTMPGDVFMRSIWHDTCQIPEFPKLRGDVKTDVLVIGGGLCGILCAHSLQNAGVSCVLVEANRLCGSTSGNTTAKITAQHGLIYHKLLSRLGRERTEQYLQVNLKALDAYRALAGQFDFDFSPQDNFVYAVRKPVRLEEELNALAKLGYPSQWIPMPDLPVETFGAVCFEHQGQMHPVKLAAALAKNLTVYENTPVQRYDGTLWHTPEGTVQAENTIVATHFPFLNKHGGYFAKLYQHRSYVIGVENAAAPPGMYVDADRTGYSFRSWEGRLLLGGGSHRTGKPGGGWQVLEDFTAAHYPGSTVTHRWAAQDCISLDAIPYVGAYSPHTPGVFAATGFNKWGMTGTMAAASLLTDLVLQKENPYRELFAPERPMLALPLASNLVHSAVNLLTPTAPRCPHMGCALKWNPQEHSWDCPCHGSRFGEDGSCLEGPANGNLRRDGH